MAMRMSQKKLKVFVSYTHSDQDRVLPLASYVSRLGLQVWMDTKEIAGGQRVIDEISAAIKAADVYMIFISPAALKSQ